MKCDRLISLIKDWYLKVQEETMAPARMVAFMEKHISQCEECLADPDVLQESEKIREIVLPPSKTPKPKVVRAIKEADEAEETPEDSDDETSEEKEDQNEDDGNDEEDENMIDDDDEI